MQGLLLIDKPQGITSFGAVAQIRRLSGEKKVGHTGTLDPIATGVLPIFLGRATALASFLSDANKSYTARIKLGTETDSCDITGNIISQSPVLADNDKLKSVLKGFEGNQYQQPPIFSAIKKNGVRFYELARKGASVDVPFRNIFVYSLELISPLDENYEFEIEVRVSKGTYIRSLARDIGRALGCGAVLTALRRTSAAGFSVDECISTEMLNSENISQFVLNEENAVKHLRAVSVTEKQAVRFINGGALSPERTGLGDPEPNEAFRIKFNGRLIGIGEYSDEQKQLKVKCILLLPENFRV